MKRNILNLKEVKELSREDLKNVQGGVIVGWSNYWTGGTNEGNATPIYNEPDDYIPTWKYRCYPKNYQAGWTYYFSNTMLNGYDCYPNT